MTDKTSLMAASASLSFFLWGMMGVSIGALLPNATEEFSLPPVWAGLVFVVWSAGFVCGSFAVERLLRIKGPPIVLAILSCLAAMLSFSQAAAGGVQWFFAVYAMLGLCGGAVFTASHTLFGEMYESRRSSALAVLDVVFSIGNMAAPLLIIAILSLKLKWPAFYMLLGAGFSIVTLFFAVQVRSSPDPDPRDEERGSGSGGIGDIPFPIAASVAAASFLLGAIEWTQNIWSVTFLMEKGLEADFARLGLSAFTAGMIVSRIAVAWSADLGRSAVATRLMLGAALIGEALIAVSSGGIPTLLGNTLLGLGIGGLFPVFLGRAMDRFPSISATMSMLMIVSLTLGGQAASFALGAAAQRWGIAHAFLATLPAIATMALAFEVARRETAR